MASITSLSNSSYNTSSIYGSRNVLSGLASGIDTESMIENAVSGIKTKIQNLLKKRTKVEWQQEAYRSIIDKAVNFNNKYTSYSSKTNLLSQSFFSNAVNTVTSGTYKDKVAASGRTSSDVQINAVKNLASAASYTVSGMNTPLGGANGAIVAGDSFNINGLTTVSAVSGRMSFQYGGTNGASFDIELEELENLNDITEVYDENGNAISDPNDSQKLAQAIRNKLKDVTYSYTKNGFQENTTADKAIKVSVDPKTNAISFSDGLGNGNKVSISSVSGEIDKIPGADKDSSSISLDRSLTKTVNTASYLSGKELSVTLDGVTKKISMDDLIDKSRITENDPSGTTRGGKFKDLLQGELDKAFGADRVEVAQDKDGKLSFAAVKDGSTLSLNGSAAEALGFSKGDSNYINDKKKLSELLGGRSGGIFSTANRVKGEYFDKSGNPVENKAPTEKTSPNGVKYYVDDKGNRVDKDGFRIDSDGKALYDFEVNGAHINVTEDTTLESLVNSINSNANAGVKVSYSKLTNEFKFTATETGSNSKVEFGGAAKALFASSGLAAVDTSAKISGALGDDYKYSTKQENFKVNVGGQDIGIHVNKNSTIDKIVTDLNSKLSEGITASFDDKTNSLVFKNGDKVLESTYGEGIAADLFGKLQTPAGTSYTAGQDAVMDVTINGKRFTDLTRSTNSFDIDGLTVNVKGTFDAVGKDGEAYEPVTFKTTTDSDKIVDAIRDFVNDYNEMITEIKSQYSTMPAQKSNGARYEPLTSEQEDGMTESEIRAYEEKAKQGILFGDSTLSGMYSKLLNAIQPGGTDGQTLREIGIGTSYSSGLTTISLDEDKLRAALESDPDKVKNAFAKTKESGSSSNGLMQTMQNTLNTYVKTTGEPKGVLITRAGSVKAPTSLNSNSLKSQMDSIDSQIERWQNKMSDQIDRYTTQFSRLEQLIAQMNSQASAMSGLMGGTSGY